MYFSDIDVSKIMFGEAQSLKENTNMGTKIRVSYEGKPIVMELPLANLKWDGTPRSFSGEKPKAHLVLTIDENMKTFRDWLAKLDEHTLSVLGENMKRWTGKNLSDADIKTTFMSCVKDENDGSTSFRAELRVDDENKICTPVYHLDQDVEDSLDPEMALRRGAFCVAKVRLADVYISGNGRLSKLRFYVSCVKCLPPEEEESNQTSNFSPVDDRVSQLLSSRKKMRVE